MSIVAFNSAQINMYSLNNFACYKTTVWNQLKGSRVSSSLSNTILVTRQLVYDVSVILPSQSGFIYIVPRTGTTLKSKTRSTLMAKGIYRLPVVKNSHIEWGVHPQSNAFRFRNRNTVADDI